MDRSVLHSAVSTAESMQVSGPVSEDGCIVSEMVLSIRTVQGSVDLIIGPIHCL